MKIIFTISLLLTGLLSVNAQDDLISRHFSQHEVDPAIEKIELDRATFNRFANIETDDPKERRLINAFQQLDGIKAIFKEHSPEAYALAKAGIEVVNNDNAYEELMSANTQRENLLLVIREEEEVVKELSILVGADQNFMVATLYGDIDLKALSAITTVLQENGKAWFKHFENIAKEELTIGVPSAKNRTAPTWDEDLGIKIFPNPASTFIRLEAKDSNTEPYEVAFFSLIGEQLQTTQKVQLPHQINLADLPTGTYVVRLTAPDGRFKNYRIIKSDNRP